MDLEATIPLPEQRVRQRETYVTIVMRSNQTIYVRGPFGIIHNQFGAFIHTGQPFGLWDWLELNRRLSK